MRININKQSPGLLMKKKMHTGSMRKGAIRSKAILQAPPQIKIVHLLTEI